MDCLEGLKLLDDNSIHCCVTSPPYWGLRDYGVDGQLGFESTPEEYVSRMVEIFREVKRVLRDDGTLWLNLGDSYAGSGKRQTQDGCADPKVKKCHGMKLPKNNMTKDLKPKDLVGIPWMVAFALRADGWYLRQDIIWHKPNPMPESVTDRCTKAHEYIFLLSKSQKYYYDHEAIKEPVAESTIGRGPVSFGGEKGRNYKPNKGDPNYRGGNEQWGRIFDYTKSCKSKNIQYDGQKPNTFHMKRQEGLRDELYFVRNKRSVWTVTTKPFKEAHFATFPPELITPCIKAGCPKGGTVLDPFMGAGTTAIVAYEWGCNYIGIELNKEYCNIAEKQIKEYTAQIRFDDLIER